MTPKYDLKYNEVLSFLTAMWYNSINNKMWNIGWTMDLIMLFQSHKAIQDLEYLCQLYEMVGPEMEPDMGPENVH